MNPFIIMLISFSVSVILTASILVFSRYLKRRHKTQAEIDTLKVQLIDQINSVLAESSRKTHRLKPRIIYHQPIVYRQPILWIKLLMCASWIPFALSLILVGVQVLNIKPSPDGLKTMPNSNTAAAVAKRNTEKNVSSALAPEALTSPPGLNTWGIINTPSAIGNVLTDNISASMVAASYDGKTIFVWDDIAKLMYKSLDGGFTFGTPISIATTGKMLDMKISITFATDNTLALANATEVWWTTDAGTSYTNLFLKDLKTKLEGGTITSMDIGNYYLTNTPSIVIGVTGGEGHYSNVLRFGQGEDAWTEIGTLTTAGIGNFNVVGVAFSPNHLEDAEILCVYTNQERTTLASRIANYDWNTKIPSVTLKTGFSAKTARIAMASDYIGGSGDPLLVGLNGSGSDDIIRINYRGPDAGIATDLDVSGTSGRPTSIDRIAIGGSSSDATIIWSIPRSATIFLAKGLIGTFSVKKVFKQPTGSNSAYPVWTHNLQAFVVTTGSDGALSESNDQGASWNQTALMNVGTLSNLRLINFTWGAGVKGMFLIMGNSSTGYASSYLFNTTDGGIKWTRILAGTGFTRVSKSPAYVTDKTFLVCASGSNTVLISTDDGASFSSLNEPVAVTVASMVENGNFYYGSINGFYRSWYPTNASGLNGAGRVFSIARNLKDINKKSFAIGTSTGMVYETTDDGVSFTRKGTSAVAIGDNIYVGYDVDGNLFAAGDGTTSGGIFKWNGSTWISLGITPSARGLVIVSGTIYCPDAKTGGGIFRSLQPLEVISNGIPNPEFQQMNALNYSTFNDAYTLSSVSAAVNSDKSNILIVIENSTTLGKYGYRGRLYGIIDTFTVGPVITSPLPNSLGTTPYSATVTWSAIAGAPISFAPQKNTTYTVEGNMSNVFDLANAAADIAFTTPTSKLMASWLDPSGGGTSSTALKSGTNYYIRVRAVTPVYSRYSQTSITTPLQAIDSSANIGNLVVPVNHGINIAIDTAFSWPSVPGALGYYFVISQETGQTDKFAIIDYSATTPTNSFKVRDTLKNNTQYWWRVQPYNASATGPWTTYSFTTVSSPNSTGEISPLTGAVGVPIDVTFSWPPVSGATGYYFVISQETGQTDKFAIIDYSATTPTNSFKVRDTLKNNTQYWWKVQPYNATTTGLWTTSFFTTVSR